MYGRKTKNDVLCRLFAKFLGGVMAVFVWEGKTAQGKVLKGEMEAINQAAVLARLRSQRIQPNPARVREKGKGLEKELTIPGMAPKIQTHDVMLFTRQFATMIDAGLP